MSIAHSLNVPHSTPAVGHQSSYHFYTYALVSKVLEALKAGAQVLTRAEILAQPEQKAETNRRKAEVKEKQKREKKSERLKNRKKLKKRPRKQKLHPVKVQSLVLYQPVKCRNCYILKVSG